MKKIRCVQLITNLVIPATIMLFASVSFPQNLEDGWKGIKPFKTDKATVDKLLGKPEVDDNGYYRYKTKDAFIEVNFSTTPCAEDLSHPGIKRGRYNIPAGRVLSYTVYLGKASKLSESRLNVSKYRRDTSGDVLNIVYYLGDDILSFRVHVQTETEYLDRLMYRPREVDEKSVECHQLNLKP